MKALIVANWKMNPPTSREAKKLFDGTKKIASRARGITVVVAPPVLYTREFAKHTGAVSLAAQNVHAEVRGSFTGEISVLQVKDAGVKYCIVGHAERRGLQEGTGESDAQIAAKVQAVTNAGMTAILCIGEKERGAEAKHFNFLREQLRASLPDGVATGRLVLAYEPLWAIGASEPMRARDMQEMAIFLRKLLLENLGSSGQNVKILYGGSVDATTAPDLMKTGIAGLLVGRASVDIRTFTELLRAVAGA